MGGATRATRSRFGALGADQLRRSRQLRGRRLRVGVARTHPWRAVLPFRRQRRVLPHGHGAARSFARHGRRQERPHHRPHARPRDADRGVGERELRLGAALRCSEIRSRSSRSTPTRSQRVAIPARSSGSGRRVCGRLACSSRAVVARPSPTRSAPRSPHWTSGCFPDRDAGSPPSERPV